MKTTPIHRISFGISRAEMLSVINRNFTERKIDGSEIAEKILEDLVGGDVFNKAGKLNKKGFAAIKEQAVKMDLSKKATFETLVNTIFSRLMKS